MWRETIGCKEVAPYAHGEHDGYEFTEQLLRIADFNPQASP